METVVDFISKLSENVRDSLGETGKCIGKEVVDTTAGRKGLCVDKIMDFFGTKISFLGVRYTEDELSKINSIDKDVLVCQTKGEKFFIPMSEISAAGKDIILLKYELKVPEIEDAGKKKEEIFKRFYLMREAIKDVLPNSISPSEEKESKKWLKKLIGE